MHKQTTAKFYACPAGGLTPASEKMIGIIDKMAAASGLTPGSATICACIVTCGLTPAGDTEAKMIGNMALAASGLTPGSAWSGSTFADSRPPTRFN